MVPKSLARKKFAILKIILLVSGAYIAALNAQECAISQHFLYKYYNISQTVEQLPGDARRLIYAYLLPELLREPVRWVSSVTSPSDAAPIFTMVIHPSNAYFVTSSITPEAVLTNYDMQTGQKIHSVHAPDIIKSVDCMRRQIRLLQVPSMISFCSIEWMQII